MPSAAIDAPSFTSGESTLRGFLEDTPRLSCSHRSSCFQEPDLPESQRSSASTEIHEIHERHRQLKAHVQALLVTQSSFVDSPAATPTAKQLQPSSQAGRRPRSRAASRGPSRGASPVPPELARPIARRPRPNSAAGSRTASRGPTRGASPVPPALALKTHAWVVC